MTYLHTVTEVQPHQEIENLFDISQHPCRREWTGWLDSVLIIGVWTLAREAEPGPDWAVFCNSHFR